MIQNATYARRSGGRQTQPQRVENPGEQHDFDGKGKTGRERGNTHLFGSFIKMHH
jgi:hypothetical protein